MAGDRSTVRRVRWPRDGGSGFCWSTFFRRLVKRSVCAEALARDGGWARNDGELGSMWRKTFGCREFSVDQDSSMSVEAVRRTGGGTDGVSADGMT